MIKDVNIRLKPWETAHESLKRKVADFLGLKVSGITSMKVIGRSIDARQRQVMVNLKVAVATEGDEIFKSDELPDLKPLHNDSPEVIIVGTGPAGLFAAIRAIELGVRPILLERGKDVDARRIDLAAVNRTGSVLPDSNYCFGEGGAGAYSDGKLYTRSKKRGDTKEILRIFHKYGAPRDILVDAHPHIGSDRLPDVIRNIRKDIIRCGGKVMFNTRVTSLTVTDKYVTGVKTERGETFSGPVILATGHSARDVYRMLLSQGITLEKKSLAIGVRLEHPQSLIDSIQYHTKEGRGQYLPPAEYSFVTQSGGRGVYSFCMCPGGYIVPAASAPGELVVNGMSPANRGTRWANSGIVVEVHPGDIPGHENAGELEMLELQEEIEQNFFNASGHSLNAPAQRMKDFVEKKISSSLPETSYAPGIHSAPVHFLLPPFISERLRDGFRKFGKSAPGFLTNEATVIGLESRTSSPVRITRDRESLVHIEFSGLYPAGEGAGYAGGIVSAAIDGRRCAEACCKTIQKPTY